MFDIDYLEWQCSPLNRLIAFVMLSPMKTIAQNQRFVIHQDNVKPAMELEFIKTTKELVEACKKYEDIFATKIAPKARIELLRLIHRAINHEPITLVCFCAPKQCHGDYLKKVIDEAVIHFTSNPLALAEFNKTYELYCLPKSSD